MKSCYACGDPTYHSMKGWGPLCWPCRVALRRLQAQVAKIMGWMRRHGLPAAREFLCVDCGAWSREWDHRDYREPDRIEPVCCGCNHRRGLAKETFA